MTASLKVATCQIFQKTDMVNWYDKFSVFLASFYMQVLTLKALIKKYCENV